MRNPRGIFAKHPKTALSVAAAAVVVGGVLAGLGVSGSGAWFTDSESVNGNSFATGTVAMTVDNGASGQTIPLTVTGMAPGDVHYEAIKVANTGSLALRYAVKQTTETGADAGLTSALTIATKTVATSTTCTDANSSGFASGTAVANALTSWSTSGSNYIGNTSTLSSGASDTGSRTLNPSASEILCVQVTLPSSAANTVQGKSTAVDLDFEAIQTKNIG